MLQILNRRPALPAALFQRHQPLAEVFSGGPANAVAGGLRPSHLVDLLLQVGQVVGQDPLDPVGQRDPGHDPANDPEQGSHRSILCV